MAYAVKEIYFTLQGDDGGRNYPVGAVRTPADRVRLPIWPPSGRVRR